MTLGPRASFLLGMLVAGSRTPDELHALLGEALDVYADLLDDAQALGASPDLRAAVAAMFDAGPVEVGRLLDRLAAVGLASRVELGGSVLYAPSPVVGGSR